MCALRHILSNESLPVKVLPSVDHSQLERSDGSHDPIMACSGRSILSFLWYWHEPLLENVMESLSIFHPCLCCRRSRLDASVQNYNLYKENSMEHLSQSELNGEMVFEGVLKIFWGLKKAITLLPRPSLPKRRSVFRSSLYGSCVQLSEDSEQQVLWAFLFKSLSLSFSSSSILSHSVLS